jgi:hypothetical protein
VHQFCYWGVSKQQHFPLSLALDLIPVSKNSIFISLP